MPAAIIMPTSRSRMAAAVNALPAALFTPDRHSSGCHCRALPCAQSLFDKAWLDHVPNGLEIGVNLGIGPTGGKSRVMKARRGIDHGAGQLPWVASGDLPTGNAASNDGAHLFL